MIFKSALKGIIGTSALALFYFLILTLVSGWNFTLLQFTQNWYWVISLSLGFGIQIGLLSYLRAAHSQKVSGKTAALSGTVSGLAMIACCSHYLANLIPFIAISGFAVIIGQYQTEFFIVGLVFNLLGISFMIYRFKTAIKI